MGGGAGPVITLQLPAPQATQVSPTGSVRFAVFSANSAPSIVVRVNGAVVYDGTFALPYRGFVKRFANRTFVEFAPLTRHVPGSTLTVVVEATDATVPVTTNSVWTYHVVDPEGYQGNALLEEESWLLQPMQRFLELEPVRLLLLQRVLKDNAPALGNPQAIAARVLYQLAYETELSALLNAFTSPNAAALQVSVPWRRSAYELQTVLDGYTGRINRGVQQLFDAQALPREYRNNLVDQLGSLLYSYRVAAVAVLVLLARAVEVYSARAGASPLPTPTPDAGPFLVTEDGYTLVTEDGYVLEY